MNKIYKVIWSKIRNCYVAVSELAKNHGKNSVRSEKRGLVKGTSALLALCIVLSLGIGGSAWAADDTVVGRYINIGQTPNTISTTNNETGAAIGRSNKVYGDNAIAVGIYNSIGTENPESNHWNGFGSIVVGGYSRAWGQYSAAFGQGVSAIGDGSFAQGGGNVGGGGKNTTATGRFASAFNRGTEAIGEGSASHGFETIASADWSFASGYRSTAWGTNSAVFGYFSQAAGNSSFAAGYNTKAGFSFLDEDGNPKTLDENGNTQYPKSYAAAFGRNTTASGEASFATGYYTNASGFGAAAFNDYTKATGAYASAFNYYTEAAGMGSAAFGGHTHAIGSNSFAIGSNTQAIGQNAFAAGYSNQAIGKDSVAFGNNTYALTNRSLAFGSSTTAGWIDPNGAYYGEDSVAFGLNTKAVGNRSTAMGSGTFASGELSIASGNMTRALGQASVASGSYTAAYGQNAKSFGEYTHAIAKNSTAFGHYTTAGKRLQTEEEKALGIYTMVDPYTGEQTKVTKVNKLQYASMLTDANGNVVTDNDPNHIVDTVDRNYIIYHAKRSKNTSLYAIRVPIKDADGNPTGEYKIREVYQKPNDDTWYIYSEQEQAQREQAAGNKPTLLLNYDGIFVTDTSVKTDNAVAFGNDTEASAENALAFGDATLASNKRATAFGNHTVATGDSATSFGDTTLAAGRNATTFGESTVGTMQNTTAFGQESAALAKNATAFGVRTKALGQASTTWGDESIAPGKYSTAFGEDSEAFAQDSAAWGSKTVAGIDKENATYTKYKEMLAALREKENQLKILKKNGVTADILNADGEVETKGSISLEAEIREDEAALIDKYAELKNLGKAATAFGENTNAIGAGSTAWGSKSVATGKYSTAFGESSKAYGQNSVAGLGGTTGSASKNATGAIAIGKGSKAQEANNIALGQKANAQGTDTIAIGAVDADGKGSTAKGANSIAIGTANTVEGANSIAIGTGHIVKGKNSGAFGDPDTVNGDDSYVIGNNSTINKGVDDAFILGNTASVTTSGGVALGTSSVAARTEGNGVKDSAGSRAGFDVRTGTYYKGTGKEGPTWTSTLAAVSVGEDTSDGSIGAAATKTRQITGVAAGTADTDAVNVAQLKLAVGAGGAAPIDTDNRNVSLVNDDTTGKQVITSPYIHVEGVKDAALDTYAEAAGTNSIAIGYKANAQIDDSVALGSGSVANRGAGVRGVNPLNVPVTAAQLAGAAWTSTAAAVSVGNVTITENKDGSKTVTGTTRQITGVAAGTEPTDAVNVAQLEGFATHYYSVNTDNTVDDVDPGDAKDGENSNYDNMGAVGKRALAAGYYTSATGEEATALGNKSLAKGENSVATGYRANAQGENSVALGVKAEAFGESSSAMGIDSTAVGRGGLAIGHGSSTGVKAEIHEGGADDFWTTTVQVDTDETGKPTGDIKDGGIAIGSYAHTEGTRALAVGRVASAYGTNSTAMGLRSSAFGEGSMAFGHGVVAGSEDDKYAVQVTDLHNNPALDYDLDGKDNTGVKTSNVIGAVALGSYAEATGRGSLSVGRYSEAQSAYTVAMGIRAEAGEKSENAIAIGREAKVASGSGDYGGANSIAMGTLANVKGMNSIAIGTAEFTNEDGTDVLNRDERKGTTVTGDRSIAIGQSDTIEGDNSIAIGTGHVIKGDKSGAFGDPSTITGSGSYAVGNDNTIEVDDGFILGNNASVTAAGGVALGSGSVASRDKDNGGAGAGFDVTTGTNYAGEGSGSATWTSTLAAVSVGGDSKDGSIGAAATATRQITGVAAGTADTDAVNVAQLKLAVGGVTYTAGKNITIVDNVINAAGSVYTANQTVEAGENPGEGSTTLNITDGDGGDAGSMTIKAGDNVTITEVKDGDRSIAVINATDTTYSITSEAGEAGTNVVSNYTMTGTNGDTYTFQDTNTTYTAEQSVDAGDDWGKGNTAFNLKGNDGTDAGTMTVRAGKNVKITKGDNGEAVIQGNGLTGDTYEVEYDDNGVGSVTIKDQAGNTATITNIQAGGGEGIADSINYLGDRINNLDKKINKVGAGAAALAGLHPLDFDPDEKWDFAAAAGSYKGEHAMALGAFYRPNEDTMISIGGTIGNGNNMVNVGISWKFGQKNRISANRISSAKEIIELRKNQEDVHSFLADAVAGNQLDLSKIQLFPDVEENHWAYDYVATMAGNGVLEGYPDGYFKGNRNMTRYEMAAVLYRLMQNGARLSDRALTEFAPELDRIRVDTITKHKDGTPHIQRVRTIKERVDEKADPSSEKNAKKKAKVKVAEKPVE